MAWLSRRGALAIFTLLAVTVPLGCASPAGSIRPLPGPPAKVLIVPGHALRALLIHDRHLTGAFAGRTTYVIGPGASQPTALRLSGAVQPTALYTSFAAFAADVAAGRLRSPVHTVLYDVEKWAATPTIEQQHPRQYMLRFSELARAHGLFPILAPARDLVLVPGGICVKRRGESLSSAYLRCGLAGADADAAALVVQSQIDQSDVALFHRFLAGAARQARAGNPRIAVLAQLATAPLGQPASLAQLVAAARSAAGLVQGFSLDMRTADMAIADALLWSFKRG
jgi:hypothetical protein